MDTGQSKRKLLLFIALSATLSPLAMPAQVASYNQTPPVPSAYNEPITFAVATVRPADPHFDGFKLQPTLNGFTARGTTLWEVIREAYAAYQEGRLQGGPAWLKSERFDIDAKFDSSDVTHPEDLTLGQRRQALQALLADRFALAVHKEQREMPAYALVAIKGGKLHETSTGAKTDFAGIKGLNSLVTVSQRGHLEGTNFSSVGLAHLLEPQVRRIIVDQTGLNGRYDFILHWTPDDPVRPLPGSGSQTTDADENTWPALPTALKEQLGLKLEPTKTSVEVIVIDRVEKPTAN